MRSSFLYLLIATIVTGTVYWYQDTKYLCPIPLSYRIGEINDSFDLSYQAARARAAEAERIWEEETGVTDLFVYDEQADFTINFIFDERQELTDTEESERKALDARQAENEAAFAALEQLEREYDAANQAYTARLARYEERLSAYNNRVDRYNAEGGAPDQIFAELEAERAALAEEATALERETAAVNTLVSRLNQESEAVQAAINSYNEAVAAYNEQFGFSREFTQGDYQGDRINIYTFSSKQELERVLVHEFGHALGIDHVDGEDSVMYYLLKETDQPITLSEADLAAFAEVCGAADSFPATIRRGLRTLLALFS